MVTMSTPRAAPDTGRTLLDFIALGLLVDGPKHGYGLYGDYTDSFRTIWRAGRSKFYATLAGLLEEGYLNATTELQEKRPPRKVYHLTQTGEDILRAWLYEPASHPRDVRVVVPVKLRLLEMLGWPDIHRLLDAQIEKCQARLTREVERANEARVQEADLSGALIFDLRCRQLEAMIDWLAYCKTQCG